MAEEGQVIAIHEAQQFRSIVEKETASGKLIVIDFTASWCPPCRFIAPVFAEMAKQHVGVIFLKVDVDDVKEISEEYEVTAMPTFLFMKEGKEVDRFVGADKMELGRKVVELSATPATSTA